MPPSNEPRILVPDTNFWLHAQMPFDFAALAGVRDFIVAVPLTVIDELDDRKEAGLARSGSALARSP